MKHLSLQWRITLLTALLIACACVCMNLLLYRTGVTGMDALNGFMMQYQPGSADSLTIEIPQEEMSSLLAHFSQEVYDAKVVFGRKGWCITAVVTILSAAIAYFVSGRALKPLQQLAQQAQRVDQDSIATVRLDEDTVQEFGQLSRSVNRMLDGLAQSFELQRQFAGNAAHELRTPLAILQTKLELFAEEHPAMDAETAGLVSSLREQLDRLTALVRTLLEMSNLQSVSRTDQIALAPLVEEILTDLTSLAQKNNISLQQDCAELGMVGSDALIYRLVFNLVENGIKYNRPGGAVRVTLQQEKQTAVLRIADTGPGIPADCRESIFQPFFRVDKSRSREMGGVGLGLALVREIAVLHGGSVTVDGIDVRQMPQAQLHDLLGYVPQKGVLFSGTIDSNLKFGGEDITDAQVHKAAAIAQATDFIEAKSESYQSPIAQGGSNVSGGQKQRLSIARAIAKNPKVYLFDDSFSALDYKTDVTLRRALKAQTDNATVIIVAQRISTVLHANQILVLDEGRLVGKGTHAQLMVSCPEYQEIARSQLSQKELDLEPLNTEKEGV